MIRSPIRIAARSTELAQRHARWVAERLADLGHTSELIEIGTLGDSTSAGTWRGAGLFVTSVQAAVREGRADVAVRPFADLQAVPADGLEVAAVPSRAAANDALLLRPGAFDADRGPLPAAAGARIGTGAAHRTAQLRALRPDLRLADVRGEPLTHVAEMREAAGVDGLLVAAAVLDWLALDLGELLRVDLEPSTLLPAPGQGALALEIRRGDPLGEVLADLHDARGFPALAAERGLLAMLEAGRQPELAAHAVRSDHGRVVLDAWLGGARVTVRGGSGEEAALLAFNALTRARR